MTNTARFKVEDMTCGHCVKTITNAITSAYPNAKVETNLENHEVTIAGIEDASKIASIIKEEGYSPQSLKY